MAPAKGNTITFNPEEKAACQRLVEMAWEEDLGPGKVDLTTQALIPPDLQGQAVFVARAPGVVAGLPAVELVLSTSRTPLLQFQPLMEDGTRVRPGDRLASVTGSLQDILMAERTALNFLQHLSGIATTTRQYVDAVEGLPCAILDTRKTVPGWRLLEKYAVRQGGGHNHRMGLYDGILVKDNHLAILGTDKTSFSRLPESFAHLSILFRTEVGKEFPLEIELESLDQLDQALRWADIILLDNMDLDQLREAVRRRNEKKPKRILLEASGGVTLANVRAIAETGVDRISVGALTHSAPALDIALDFIKE
jgi:nicotinate-nucleotide pyrophosphorylase (carboxylating)